MAEENEKPVVAPPVFAFEKNKAHKRTAEDSSPEDGEDSDKDDGRICSAAKRGRKAPFTNFPPTHSVSKNNVFMPSSFCQSPSGNSDSEPEEKPVGFRLKPPILIHGQAPSAGVPCPKPKEAQRSILRPPLLQPPPARMTSDTHTSNSSSNGVESPGGEPNCGIMLKTFAPDLQNNVLLMKETEDNRKQKNADVLEGRCGSSDASFVFGENVKDRVEIDQCESSERGDCVSKDKSEETNYFLQYINTSSPQKNDNPDNRATFVFGKNMMDRVVALPKEPEGVSIESQAESGLLNKPLIPSSSPEQASDNYENKKESLEESAARHESHRAQKCLLDRVEVRTGEEAERNVLQMLCKLFVFEPTSQSWLERGCGVLRLNDMASTDDGAFQSRLVMRTQGSLRVILNTKLWPQMQVDKASEKSLRVTAMDTEEQGVKVFLISSSSKDAAQLFVALHHRILALRSISGQECDDHPDRETMGFSDDDESRTPPITAAPLPGDSEEAVCSSIGDV